MTIGPDPKKAAIVDPLASLRRGLAATLSRAGFEPVELADLDTWFGSEEPRAVILALLGAVEGSRLSALRDSAPHRPIVALLVEPDVEIYRWALRSGRRRR